MCHKITSRFVEAYLGEYAAGKSEVAVNRALDLVAQGRKVTLADLDIVEPCYTLRPLKRVLTGMGVNVLAWETRETFGLGETGNLLRAGNRWALKYSGDIILDVGYGVKGAATLNLLEGAADDADLKVYVVINISRPMTASVSDIVAHVRSMGSVDGLINNTHLGDETTAEVVAEGARVVNKAAQQLNIPVVATTAVEEIARQVGTHDPAGNPVRSIRRFMPQTFW